MSVDKQEIARMLLPWATTVFLSCFGGFVQYIERLRKGAARFRWRELFFDLVISSFAGILTHLMCAYAGLDGTMSAILIAVSGHMGTRALASFEGLRDRVFGFKPEKKDED